MTAPTTATANDHARLLVTLMLHREDLPVPVADQLGNMSHSDLIDVTFALSNLSATLVNVLAHHRTDVDGPGLWQMLCSRITAEENA